MKETKERTVVEHTSPIWRVAGVALAFGAIAALGYYFQEIGYVDEFSTVAVITVFFSVSFWARKRPDRLRRRFGPFGRIASAIQESGNDIREFVYERPLRVGVVIAAGYGVAVVIAKSALVAILTNIYAWPLAVAAGCAVGALVSAPEYFANLFRRVSLPNDDEDSVNDASPVEEDEYLGEGLEDENEIGRARRDREARDHEARRAAGEE